MILTNNLISSLQVDKRCICRFNSNFKLCNRITNDIEYCRYHNKTKNGYIYKIFYNVFKNKNEFTIGDLYELYKYINTINYLYIKELYIELLKCMPYKMLNNMLDISNYNLLLKKNYKSKMEKYVLLYEINKNTYDLDNNKKNIERLIKIQKDFKNKMFIKYEPDNNTYMNDEDLFTFTNIKDISIDRLFILKNCRNEKYVFDAVELEYFVRMCNEYKQVPYNPYNREVISKIILDNLNKFIKCNNLIIKDYEYKWDSDIHAFTDLSIEIERRGFYNNPEWFKTFTNVDFLKVIKYFKLLSSSTPENSRYFNNFTEETLIFDFCKDAIKMFKECGDDIYILCCNFIKSLAMCSNNFYENMPRWLISCTNNIDDLEYNTDTVFRIINRANITDLENNFLLYYYVEHT